MIIKYIYYFYHILYQLNYLDHTIPRILKLADQFQMEVYSILKIPTTISFMSLIQRVLDNCNLYLTQSKGFDVVKKLLLADQYRLVTLRVRYLMLKLILYSLTSSFERLLQDHFLNSYTSVTDLLDNVKVCVLILLLSKNIFESIVTPPNHLFSVIFRV